MNPLQDLERYVVRVRALAHYCVHSPHLVRSLQAVVGTAEFETFCEHFIAQMKQKRDDSDAQERQVAHLLTELSECSQFLQDFSEEIREILLFEQRRYEVWNRKLKTRIAP